MKSLIVNTVRTFYVNVLFHIPMVCIRWCVKFINNDTKSRFVYLLYTIMVARRKYGKQTFRLSFVNRPKTVVSTYFSGCGMGLNDMLNGIAVASDYCSRRGLTHKISIKTPYQIEDYLQPATYDWQMIENQKDSDRGGRTAHLVIEHMRALELELYILDLFTSIHSVTELYIVMAAPCPLDLYHDIFPKIFTPSKKMLSYMMPAKAALDVGGKGWVSVSFRFANLLGDNDEKLFETQPESDASKLMDDCFNRLLLIRASHRDEGIFVTSDSNRFLRFVCAHNLNGVFSLTSDEDGRHIGYCSRISDSSVLKMFGEYILISKATKAYQVKLGQMYLSHFPRGAAVIGNIPYEVVTD